jgi:O-antigen/teichoic acid export membrane protein
VVKTLSRFVNLARPSALPQRPRLVLLTYKLAADAVSKGVTLLVFVVAARQLRVDELGVLALAMTTGWLLSVASDAGLPLDLARTVARRAAAGTLRPSVVSEAMRWRGWLALGALGIGTLAAGWLSPPGLRLAFTLVVIAQVASGALETLAHAFRGLNRSDVEASITLIQRAVTGAAACGVLLWRPTLITVSLALTIPPVIALAVALTIARRLSARAVNPAAGDTPLAGRFVRDVAPLGLGIFLSAVYFRCDVFFIERWHGYDAVGIYNAAFRSVEALRLFPAAVMALAFPTFCTARTLAPLTTTSMWLLLASVAPALGLVMLPVPLLEFVYGPAFNVAAPALQVLGLALPLFFVNYALTHQVIAWDGQRAYLGLVVAALTTSVLSNLVLVPSGGMRGAALATLLTELVLAAGCLVALAIRAGRVRRAAALEGTA